MITHPLSLKQEIQYTIRDKEIELRTLEKVDQTHENPFTLWVSDRMYILELDIFDLKEQLEDIESGVEQ